MMPKRKPLSMLIAIGAGRKPGHMGGDMEAEGGDDEEEMSEGGKYDDPGMIQAAEDMIDAFKNRDAKALHRALCDHAAMHEAYEDESPSTESSDDKSGDDY